MKNKFKSDLSIAKNLGSAGSGSGHWWHQRFTAILLAFSIAWVFCFFGSLKGADLWGIIEVLKKPYNLIMLILFVIVGLYHSALGMQVVIEDYVTCRTARILMVLFVQIFSIVTMISFVVSLLYVMIL